MHVLPRPYRVLHMLVDGAPDAPALLLCNSLGTDLRIWDALIPYLTVWRLIRYDKQGHGLSDLGDGSDIADHAADATAILDSLGCGAIVIGCSIGGLIGQRLAAERHELVRAPIPFNSAAKLGTVPDSPLPLVEIVVGDVIIRVSPDFDEAALRRVVRAVRSV